MTQRKRKDFTLRLWSSQTEQNGCNSACNSGLLVGLFIISRKHTLEYRTAKTLGAGHWKETGSNDAAGMPMSVYFTPKDFIFPSGWTATYTPHWDFHNLNSLYQGWPNVLPNLVGWKWMRANQSVSILWTLWTIYFYLFIYLEMG